MDASTLTKEEHQALRELWYGENLHATDKRFPPYPGAIGRVGARLVKHGLATRMGLFTYHTSARYTRYILTEPGRQLALTCFGDQSFGKVSTWLIG